MEKQSGKGTSTEQKSLLELSEAVGNFIRYWGFRRIHGQIWTQVYLSKDHLSGAELTERLGVSKALVSPALTELEEHGLIEAIPDGLKTKRYRAKLQVLDVIKSVLKKREAEIIADARKRLDKLKVANSKLEQGEALTDASRIEDVEKMVELAHFGLHFLIGELKEKKLDEWFDDVESASS